MQILLKLGDFTISANLQHKLCMINNIFFITLYPVRD